MTDEKTPAAPQEAVVEVVQSTSTTTGVFAAEADEQGGIVAGVIADDKGVIAEGAIDVEGDQALVVARFADMDAAKEAYYNLIEREIDGTIDIEGVLVANCDGKGKVHIIKMTDHKTRNGFLAGAVAGAAIGIIFPPAVLASAFWVGVGGAAIGKARNVHMKSGVSKELVEVLPPGSSGIIAIVRLTQVDAVKAQMPKAEEVKAEPVDNETAAAVKEAAAAAGDKPEAKGEEA